MKARKDKFIFEREFENAPVAGVYKIKLEYTFYPEEKMVRYYADGSGFPGVPADADFVILSVEFDNKNCDTSVHDWFYKNANEIIRDAIINEEEERHYMDEWYPEEEYEDD